MLKLNMNKTTNDEKIMMHTTWFNVATLTYVTYSELVLIEK
jgi:hypothetical protein